MVKKFVFNVLLQVAEVLFKLNRWCRLSTRKELTLDSTLIMQMGISSTRINHSILSPNRKSMDQVRNGLMTTYANKDMLYNFIRTNCCASSPNRNLMDQVRFGLFIMQIKIFCIWRNCCISSPNRQFSFLKSV